MNLDPHQVSQLAKKYLDGLATEQEKKMLHEWYDTVNEGDTEMVMVKDPKTPEAFGQEMLAELKEMMATDKEIPLTPATIRPFRLWRLAAAAAVLLAITTIAYLVLRPVHDSEKIVSGLNTPVQKEVPAPHSARAVITLANGQQLFLDSAKNGSLAVQGNTRLIKMSDGEIAYKGGNNASQLLQYNILTVPRGSKVMSLMLTDGTKVWLNAESSLRYPVAFIHNDRTVEITGEAYFEVSKDPSRRFYVKAGKLTTEVLGTHFNVNTYKDESTMKVTLLEGSVEVLTDNGKKSAVIRPGQQAQVNGSSAIRVVSDVDIEAVMAWKNEQFMMKGADLGLITRQMARWYDIEIVFERNVSDRKFGGSISRNVNLSTILHALKENGIESKMEGRILTIR